MRRAKPAPLRPSADYRAERLAAERHRLERRKTWAAYNLDPHALEHLERQLARLRAEERASIAPRGRESRAARARPGYFNAARWRRRL